MLEKMNHSSLQYSSPMDNSPSTLLNMKAITVLHWLIWGILAQIVFIFGTISNIINIVCFVKQGFKESINVSLTGLAVSDLGCLLPLVLSNLCYTPAFSDLDLPFEASELQYATTGLTHVLLARTSAWITAVITLERCLCVAMPLKVREIATPKRTFITVTIIFVVLIAGGSPQYYYYKLGRKYAPERNKTVIGIIYSQELINFEKVSYPINFVFVQFLAFFIIIVCTAILVIQLNVKAKWRKKSAKSSNTENLTAANKKVSKMVVMISSLFIGCFTIIIINCIVISVVPDFNINGKFRHLLTVIGGLGFLLESVNSSMNIFIYYHMSSKYREIFYATFIIRMCGCNTEYKYSS